MSDTQNYIPHPTPLKMHNDNALIRVIMGPPGSGKSAAMVMELLFMSLRQAPSDSGIRHTRWIIVRKTHRDLRDTTVETFKAWFPSAYGSIRSTAPMNGLYQIPLPDGTSARIELLFRSMDSDKALEDLDSLEVTGGWCNEGSELPEAVVLKLNERIALKRYPPRKLFSNLSDAESHVTQAALLVDYNPPPKGHWTVTLFDSPAKPANVSFFRQPAGLIEHQDEETGKYTYTVNPEAENLQAGADGGEGYLNTLQGYQALGRYDLIETRLLCRYGGVRAGKPVWNNFDPQEHVSEAPLEPRAGTEVIVAVDTSGIHPCAIVCQHVRGRWEVQDGVYGDEMGLEEFMDALLIPLLQTKYADCRSLFVCDPANARDGMTATSPTTMIKDRGYRAIVAHTNAFAPRREAVDSLFFRRNGVIIDLRLVELVEACSGEYKYRKMRATTADGASQYAAEPEKSKWSHWADALQYFALHVGRNKTEDHDARERGAAIANSVARKRRVI